MFIPDPNFSFPEKYGVKKFPDPGSGSASKNISIFTQKVVSMLSEIWTGMCISNPDFNFFPSQIPDPGVKKAPDPGF
jgi:hypothetical protein